MNRRDRLSSNVRSASAMSLLLAASVCAAGQTVALPYLVSGQNGASKAAAPVSFLAAPSFSLSDLPSSAVSADLNGDGKPDLIVASSTAGDITVYLGTGQGKFSNPAVYSTGGHPVAIAAADLRGSGRQDIIAANGADRTVSVLFGLGDGRFGPAQVYSAGAEADLLAVGSLKSGGQPGVTVASVAGKSLAVLLNDGHGVLQSPLTQSLPRTPVSLALARFTNSGNADLALANRDGTVSLLSGRGDGRFNSATLLNVASTALSLIVSADFDRDGKMDLAVAQPEGRLLTILRGNGDGTFTRGASYPVGNDAVHALSLDVNGDGIPDLVTANRGSNTFSTLLGNGDGSFQAAVHSTVGDGPVALASGDFYGRGFTGLASLNAAAKTVSIVDGNGDGSFRAAPSYSGDLSPRSIASGDLNGDGRADLVVANFCGADAACAKPGTLSVYLAKATGGYTLASKIPVGAGPVSVALADLNGDKKLDAVVLNRTGKTVSILLGAGDGTFAEPRTLALAESPAALALGDFNKDGKTDLAIVGDCGAAKCSQPGMLTLLFGTGDGSFASGRSYSVGYSPASVAVADIDLDGNPDLLVANRCGTDSTCAAHGTASLFTGDGKGGFTAGADIALGNGPSSIALDSLGGGAAPDLIVANEADGTVAVFRGNGDGTFAAPATYGVGSAPRSAVIADFTGTGRKSVAVANFKDSTVSLLANKGDGTLQPAVAYAVGAGPESLAAVTAKSGTGASIVTANASSANATPGLDITDLFHVTPDVAVATTLTITNSTSTSSYHYGAPVSQNQLTITVAPTTATTPGPTGMIALIDTSNTNAPVCTIDATTLTTADAGATYTGSCSPSPALAVGTHMISTSYTGDSVYTPLTVMPYSQTVTQAPTSVTLALSPSSGSEPVGTQIAFTATVNQVSGTQAPIGGTVTVVVSSNGTTVASAVPPVVMATGNVFSFTYTPTAVGSVTVSATYTDTAHSNFQTSTSTATIGVTQGSTTVTVTGPNPVTYGSSAGPFLATVTPVGAGTLPSGGKVTFTAAVPGQQSYTLCTSASISNGSASCTVTNLLLPPAANYTVTATYLGDTTGGGTYPSQTGTLTGVTVNKATPTVAISSSPASPASVVVNQPVSFTAAFTGLTGAAPGGGTFTFAFTPTGGTATNLCQGATTPTCPNIALHAGTYSVTATYVAGSDPFYNSSAASSPATVTVNPGTVTLTLLPASSTTTVNAAVALTATVSQATPASGSPLTSSIPVSGSIAFTYGSPVVTPCTVSIASAAMPANCSPALPPSSSPYTITAAFTNSAGDFQPMIASATEQVNKANSVISIATTHSQTLVDQGAVFTATVVGSPSGSILPSAGLPGGAVGTVTFFSDGAHLPECINLPLGTSCTTYSLTAGPHTITAAYSGDSNFFAAKPDPAAASVAQTVTASPSTISVALTSPKTTPLYATEPAIFTATVMAAPAGGAPASPLGVPLNGLVTFTITGGDGTPVSCQPVPVQGTAPISTTTAACMVTFTQNQGSNPLLVNATYTGDSNFTSSSLATPTSQTVEDFALAAPATNVPATQVPSGATAPTHLYVTQGYTIGGSAANDPLFTGTPQATVVPYSGFAATVSFTDKSCGSTTPGGPSCATGAPTASTPPGTIPLIISSAADAIPGDYTYTLTGTDESTPFTATAVGPTRTSPAFTITVVPVTANQSVSVTATETANAQFGVPAASATDTFAFACSLAVNTTTGATTTYPLPSPLPSTETNPLYCSPSVNSGRLTMSGDGTLSTTFVLGNIAVATLQAQSRAPHPGAPFFAATFIGVPFLAFIGWLGRKKYGAFAAVRLVGIAALIAGLSQAIGCGSGGGFTVPANSAAATAFTQGDYMVRVAATDQSTKVIYYSTIKFTAGK